MAQKIMTEDINRKLCQQIESESWGRPLMNGDLKIYILNWDFYYFMLLIWYYLVHYAQSSHSCRFGTSMTSYDLVCCAQLNAHFSDSTLLKIFARKKNTSLQINIVYLCKSILESNIGNCAKENYNYSIALLFLENWDI